MIGGPTLNMAVTGDQHKLVLDAVKRRFEMSRNKMADRHRSWEKAEDQFVAYVNLDAKEQARGRRRDQGKAQYTTIEIPYSYAQLLASHTYWTSIFLGRQPVFQYSGRHGETEDSVQAIEALIDYQLTVGVNLVPLYIWLMDVGKYGQGVVGTYWDKEEIIVSRVVEVPKTYMGMAIPFTKQKSRVSERTMGYMGNRIYNVRPYDWFPDPRVPLVNFQKGEFCGRKVEVGWNWIFRKAAQGIYTNVAELKKTRPKLDVAGGSPRLERPNQSGGTGDFAQTGQESVGFEDRLDFVDLLEMYVDLIPKDWGFGASTYPEKWVFVIGNSQIVLHAGPLGCYHNSFPFDLIEYEIEGYGLFKRSMLEIQKPMNDTLTWLFNAHFHNVRKVLNDQLIVDPSRLEMKDLLNPDAGRLVRLKPEAYGTDAREAVHQLAVTDITRSHITDSDAVMRLMDFIVGVNQTMMGAVNSGGRKSATEVRTSSTFGINRQKTNAEFFSAMGFAPLSAKMLSNTQQNYDIEQKFKVAGPLLQRASRFVTATPELIAGFYDYMPIDGTMPIDRFAMASLWKDLMTQMAAFPSLMMQYDLGAVFGHVAHLAGVKNLEQFKFSIQPDEQLVQQAQMGNVVPIGGPGSGPRGPGVGGTTVVSDGGTTQRPAGPRQIGGVGAAA